MSDLIKREDALNALSHGNGCGNICSNAISRIPTAAETLWTLTSEQDPPKGEPLIVTIQAKWKDYREVLANVYYVYNSSYAKFVFYDPFEGKVIGPSGVKVVAWMRMPDACEAPVTWGENDEEGWEF